MYIHTHAHTNLSVYIKMHAYINVYICLYTQLTCAMFALTETRTWHWGHI